MTVKKNYLLGVGVGFNPMCIIPTELIFWGGIQAM